MPVFDSTRSTDLTGSVFGNWTVVEYAGRSNNGLDFRWLCRCECGNQRVVPGKSLKNRRSTACHSCSVMRGKPFEDLSGRTFGRWTVMGFSHRDGCRQRYWTCRCECGAEHAVAANMLKNSESKGCRDCKNKRQERKAYVAYFNRIRAHAGYRGIPFELTQDYIFDLLEQQGFRCPISGLEIDVAVSRDRHMHGGTTASLDRIDSTKGYVIGNVHWLHKDVNGMKWTLTTDRFLELVQIISDFQNGPAYAT